MNNTKNGFALSIVLWIVAILLLGIVFIASLSKESLHLTYMLNDKLYTQIMAKNYFEALKYQVMTSRYTGTKLITTTPMLSLPKEIYMDGRIYNLGEISISIQDLSGMIRPSYLSDIFMENNYRELSFKIKDSIQDWLDLDNEAHLNGAESVYYTIQQKLNYRPSNIYMFQSLDELKLIKGIKNIDKKIWNTLIKDKLTYKAGGINLLLIDANYLKSLFKISFDEAIQLIKLRKLDINKFMSILKQNKYFNDSIMWFGISHIINIKIIVTKKLSQTNLYATLYFSPFNHKKVFYIEGYKVY